MTYVERLRYQLDQAIRIGDHAAQVMLVARINVALRAHYR